MQINLVQTVYVRAKRCFRCKYTQKFKVLSESENLFFFPLEQASCSITALKYVTCTWTWKQVSSCCTGLCTSGLGSALRYLTRQRGPREVTGTTMWTSLGAIILSIPHDHPLDSTEWVDVFPVPASPWWTLVFVSLGLNGLARLDGKVIHW